MSRQQVKTNFCLDSRRDLLKKLGISSAALPFVAALPSLRAAQPETKRKQRLVIFFTPNGTVTKDFWPETPGENFELRRILQPVKDFRPQMMQVHGICNKVKGDGDGHMRGMSCLLTGIELLPGNIQGGSDSPAGWASGISIDQEIKNWLQSSPETRTRFGSLEFGVGVADRADPWTRMCYAGKNKPVAPVNSPYEMFAKMYGRHKHDGVLRSVLDDVQDELKRVSKSLDTSDVSILNEHAELVRKMERDLQASADQQLAAAAPDLPGNVSVDASQMPAIAKMQIDLLVNGFANDMNRIATLQFSHSVGDARMKWLGINESHHELSHDPDLKEESQEKLVQINQWFSGQMAYLLQQLSAQRSPGSNGSLLDETLLIWVNELGKGNSHTRNNLPIVTFGNAPGFRMGRYLHLEDIYHNRLWLSVAHAFGHELQTFGKPEFCEGGPIGELG